MRKTLRPRQRVLGRPPSGPAGERVSDYPPLTVRIPRATKDTLLALSALRRTPAWRLVDQAVLAYVEQLPDAERRLLSQFVAKMRSGGA
jgi:hypothetical protein